MTSKYQRRFPEEFNATLKREVLQGHRTFTTAHDARFQVEAWICDYNTIRRHLSLGYLAPIDYEQRQASLALAA